MTKKIFTNFCKRSFDIICSAVGLFLASLLFLILAVWIKLESPGPVFYRGIRAGKNNKSFKIFKFRSMARDAEKVGQLSTADDDPRITKAGRFIRKYKLDELAQLISVFLGDMSLVGPRPNVLEETNQYNEKEKKILSIRPGITDYASIKFHNEGEILRGSLDPHLTYQRVIRPEKHRLQLEYVSNHSFLTDLKIICKTISTIIKH